MLSIFNRICRLYRGFHRGGSLFSAVVDLLLPLAIILEIGDELERVFDQAEDDVGIRLFDPGDGQHAFHNIAELFPGTARYPGNGITFTGDIENSHNVLQVGDPPLDLDQVTFHVYMDDGHELISQSHIVDVSAVALHDSLFFQVFDPLDQGCRVYP